MMTNFNDFRCYITQVCCQHSIVTIVHVMTLQTSFPWAIQLPYWHSFSTFERWKRQKWCFGVCASLHHYSLVARLKHLPRVALTSSHEVMYISLAFADIHIHIDEWGLTKSQIFQLNCFCSISLGWICQGWLCHNRHVFLEIQSLVAPKTMLYHFNPIHLQYTVSISWICSECSNMCITTHHIT